MRIGTILRRFAALAVLIHAAWVPAQSFSLVDGRVPLVSLDALWRFHPGDSPRIAGSETPLWATPDFDDSAWPLLKSSESWSTQGYPGMSGYGWYRFTVIIPAGEEPTALLLAPILTSYQVYVDGSQVGGFGNMPPARLPSTQISFHIFPLTKGGSGNARTVCVAIRVWHSPIWSAYVGGGPFQAGSLAGSPKLLAAEQRHHQTMRNVLFVDSYSYSIASTLIGLAILCLFFFRPGEREYLWFAVILLMQAADNVLAVAYQIYARPPQPLNDLLDGIFTAVYIAATFCFFARVFKTHNRILGRVLLAFVACSPFLAIFYWPGWAQPATCASLQMAFLMPAILWAFWALARRTQLGNLDARLLLLPTLFDVGFFAANNLAIIFDQAGWVNLPNGLDTALPLPPFTMHLSVLLHLVFLLAMLVFLILRFTRARRREVWMAGEIEAARQVQQVLLPDAKDQCAGFTVECVYRPADQVGGDFFQQIADSQCGMLIVIGDVSGKGLPAAMMVSVLVGMIRAETARGTDPVSLLRSLNARMIGRSQGGFTTCMAAHIAADGQLTIANAGHLPPYLNGHEVEVPGSLPLGIVPQSQYEAITVLLAPGDRLTFVSDGVVEARSRSGELFGFDRTRDLSRKLAETLADSAQEFGQNDDITVVTVEFAGAPLLS
jgi:Stage II sporulation protein E (SpoIIE)